MMDSDWFLDFLVERLPNAAIGVLFMLWFWKLLVPAVTGADGSEHDDAEAENKSQ